MTRTQMEISKLHLHETVRFALEAIPDIHVNSLEKLVELVNTDGSHGTICQERLIAKMRHVLKYVPGACTESLLIVVDLLEIPIPDSPAALPASIDDYYVADLTLERLWQTSSY